LPGIDDATGSAVTAKVDPGVAAAGDVGGIDAGGGCVVNGAAGEGGVAWVGSCRVGLTGMEGTLDLREGEVSEDGGGGDDESNDEDVDRRILEHLAGVEGFRAIEIYVSLNMIIGIYRTKGSIMFRISDSKSLTDATSHPMFTRLIHWLGTK